MKVADIYFFFSGQALEEVTFYSNDDYNKRSIEILKLLNIDAIYLSVKIE
ncbi:hypothetical protein [Wolbachia endosymbiont (group B) of Limnophora tigrina]